jgi:hypothetical protein
MAQSLHLSREGKLYVEFDSKFWEIPILGDYSFSQGTNITEVTVAEMADSSNNSRRGKRAFTDSVAPAEFSFSTYARPYLDSSDHRAVEDVLWALFVGAANYDATEASGNIYDNGADTPITVVNSDDTDLSINFAGSNKLTFANANFWFKLPASSDGGADLWYKLTGAVLSEASLEFDLEGITTISWSGMAQSLTDESAPTLGTLASSSAAIGSTSNFIRNRLTQLSITPDSAINGGTAYNLVLTGGSISISNNPTFVTPESLGVVNKPLGHVMGNRTVTGSFTCYLDNDTDRSAELVQDLLNATAQITNSFDLVFNVGGTTAATPRVRFTMDNAHLEVPSHNVEDVISIECNFHALPSNISDTDEITIDYFGA